MSRIPKELVDLTYSRNRTAELRGVAGMSRQAWSRFRLRLQAGEAKEVERFLAVADRLGFTLSRRQSS